MKLVSEVVTETAENLNELNFEDVTKTLVTFIEGLRDNGYTIVRQDEVDRMTRKMYEQYKLRRAANEMFRQHLEIRAGGAHSPNIPVATGAQMSEWQAVLYEHKNGNPSEVSAKEETE